ncbi:MAG: PAS domain-containing protein, partial [Promethearchaeota archaeon]
MGFLDLLCRKDIPKDALEVLKKEKKRIEELESRLEEKEEQFRILTETSGDVIFQSNLDGIVTYCSPSITKILGYSPQEIVGTPFSKYIISSQMAQSKNVFQQAISGKNVDLVKRQLLHKNGNIRYVEINGSPIIKDGEVVGTQGIVRDI